MVNCCVCEHTNRIEAIRVAASLRCPEGPDSTRLVSVNVPAAEVSPAPEFGRDHMKANGRH
jgi:hypothetical protein